ncbi:MAG: cobyric acid synthase [Bacteroidales bacterium]|nr:cobyric acid synthase [Bacteroidales bacterium]
MHRNMHPLMFAGTGSDVGKSVITAAFCRILMQEGFSPAPFKAQNMALNSYVTPDGLEIGRAQAVQAWAAGLECHSDMNPVLLKPSGDSTSQIVLNGKVYGNIDAKTYYEFPAREKLIQEVRNAYDRLSRQHSPILLEGAGSISEINLKERDFINLKMAEYAGADVILIGDIDRGGIFASLYGTMMLLEQDERQMIKGIIINKFRGDLALFEPGIKKIEELCGVPVLGVIPFFNDIDIEEEDSVSLKRKRKVSDAGKVNIAVILLPHISNFTDFDTLERLQEINLFYSNNTEEISKADIIIIPGSKNTIADLKTIKESGVAETIVSAYKKGKSVLGVCGGYQMMGEFIYDPTHIEGDTDEQKGLGILPVTSVIETEKVTKEVRFKFLNHSEICQGYEIHMGRSTYSDESNTEPLITMEDGTVEGFHNSVKCMGSYIHGIFDNPVVIDYILSPYLSQKNITPVCVKSHREEQFDKLADHVRRHSDIDRILKMLLR